MKNVVLDQSRYQTINKSEFLKNLPSYLNDDYSNNDGERNVFLTQGTGVNATPILFMAPRSQEVFGFLENREIKPLERLLSQDLVSISSTSSKELADLASQFEASSPYEFGSLRNVRLEAKGGAVLDMIAMRSGMGEDYIGYLKSLSKKPMDASSWLKRNL